MDKILFHQKGLDSYYKIWHTCQVHMIIFMHSDGGSIVCEEKSYPIERGVLCFLGADKYHYTMPDTPAQYDRSKMFLSLGETQRLLDLLDEDSPLRTAFTADSVVYAHIPEQAYAEVEQLFEQVDQQAQASDCFQAVLLANFLRLLTHLHQHVSESIAPARGMLPQAVEYIHRHIAENIGIEQVCTAVHVSKYHFCRQFKKATGLTVMEYILKTRVMMARSMLSKPGLSVGEVSERCGFSSPAYFSRAFRRETGFSPLGYRQSLHAAGSNTGRQT